MHTWVGWVTLCDAMETLAIVVVRILEGLFAVGLVGSALVILVTSVEDVQELFGPDDPHEPQHLGER